MKKTTVDTVKRLKVLTAKNIMGKPIRTFAPKQVGEIFELFYLIGHVTKYTSRDADAGELIGLWGEFKAVRARDGKEFISHRCRTNNFATNKIIMMKESLDAGDCVNFGVMIAIVSDTSVYGFKNHTDFFYSPCKAEPLALLESRLLELKPVEVDKEKIKEKAARPVLSVNDKKTATA